jgi:uncharacterized protein YndB with AHSA1/START domain/2-polyprenyl-3-methyl-5-hydroxy-6-metoxy-1,4-benzoquinol methylase
LRTQLTKHINAPRADVYRAFLDPHALATWMVPDGMTSEVHVFEPREGGAFRISLTYDAPTSTGKTTAHTDTYHGRFVKLVPNEQIVQAIEFETDNPGMQGEMTVTISLVERDGGTELTAVHDHLPPALSPADNETGWRMSLGKLAQLVEGEARDLDRYATDYASLPFELHQARFRRLAVLRSIERHNTRRILEVGCGLEPIFTSLASFDRCVIVEPAHDFAARARAVSGSDARITVVEARIEDAASRLTGETFDAVIVSSLLHEVEDPGAILRAIRGLCRATTLLHVNVPNAASLHRQLAVAMDLIPSGDTLSEQQRRLQQRRVFDAESLDRLVTDAGFRVTSRDAILVKPFTHAQMEAMLGAGIIDERVLEGLDRLARQHPELASEISVDAFVG